MSSLIIILLAIIIIFWRPPFRMPGFFYKVFTPLSVLIVFVLILLFSILKSISLTKESTIRAKLETHHSQYCQQIPHEPLKRNR